MHATCGSRQTTPSSENSIQIDYQGLVKNMALTNEMLKKIQSKYRTHEKDTGSPQVQVAVLSARLDYLNEHFKTHEKDYHSRRGLMKMVGQRRRLLNYLHRQDPTSYKKLIDDLKIRK